MRESAVSAVGIVFLLKMPVCGMPMARRTRMWPACLTGTVLLSAGSMPSMRLADMLRPAIGRTATAGPEAIGRPVKIPSGTAGSEGTLLLFRLIDQGIQFLFQKNQMIRYFFDLRGQIALVLNVAHVILLWVE